MEEDTDESKWQSKLKTLTNNYMFSVCYLHTGCLCNLFPLVGQAAASQVCAFHYPLPHLFLSENNDLKQGHFDPLSQ